MCKSIRTPSIILRMNRIKMEKEDNIKLAVADDQKLFLRGLKFILNTFENIDIVIEAENGRDLIDKIENTFPDVVLLDIKMPVLDGIETAQILKARYPDIKLIFLSMYNDDRLISHVMEIGANGYLIKDEEPEELLRAIENVYYKGFYFNEYISKALLTNLRSKKPFSGTKNLDSKPIIFTRRELEILQLICEENTTSEIAKMLFISIRTVEGHRKNMLEKANVKNVAGLVVYAIQHEIVDLPERDFY